MAADQPRQRTELSDLVRTRMTALGLSLRRIEELTTPPGDGAAPLWKRGTLDNLLKGRRIMPPNPARLRALAVALQLSENEVKIAASQQFFGIDTLHTDDGDVRAFIRGWEELSPEDQAKVWAHMEANRPVRDS